MTDPLALELRRLQAEQADTRALVEHLLRRQLTRETRRAGRVLLPLVAQVVGVGKTFSAPALMAAALNARTPAGDALREMLADYVGEASGMRGLGWELAELQGVPLAGYRLEPAGEAREGNLWRVSEA